MLRVEGLTSSYDGVTLLRDLSFNVERGEVLCLLGASGSGKTTLLRIIAGLQHSDAGHIFFDGEDMTKKRVHERRFGLMFQEHALFPHLNVAKNIEFGLRMQSRPIDERYARVEALLSLVNLRGYGERDVASLSGGERQRVALARSLAPAPRLLMLDEPLASLDTSLRQQIMMELHKIIRQMHLTTLYVTHDQAEAFALGDKIAILNEGKLEQVATPFELYHQPATRYVAHFLGLDNVFSVADLPDSLRILSGLRGEKWLLVHPSGISIAHEEVGRSLLEARITMLTYQGSSYAVRAETRDGVVLGFSVPAGERLECHQQVLLHIAPSAWVGLGSG